MTTWRNACLSLKLGSSAGSCAKPAEWLLSFIGNVQRCGDIWSFLRSTGLWESWHKPLQRSWLPLEWS